MGNALSTTALSLLASVLGLGPSQPKRIAAAKTEYDFIIVGAGSSGCMLASRLTENPNVRVLLIEAGGDDNRPLVKMPLGFAMLQLTDVDWQFKTLPYKNLDNRVGFWPRGKLLGGSSSINNMLYVRGSSQIYDEWEAAGCTGWGWKNLYPLFKKMEDCQLDTPHEREHHGVGGMLPVSTMCGGQVRNATGAFVTAMDKTGTPFNKDYNGSTMYGAAYAQANVENGTRASASYSFLRRSGATKRPNLTIITNVQVARLHIENRVTKGVYVRANGDSELVLLQARKEVILSAGAIGSPWILMNSGIGPADNLREVGVNVVLDNPAVGANLQDHPNAYLQYRAVSGADTIPSLTSPKLLLHLAHYLVYAKGLLSSCGVEAMSFHDTSVQEERYKGKSPDLQIQFVPGLFNKNVAITNNMLHSPNTIYSHPSYPMDQPGVSFMSTLLLPRSSGYIRLKSSNPFEYPVIESGYLEDKRDRQALIDGMKFSRKAAKEMQRMGVLGDEVLDPHSKLDPESDEYLNELAGRVSSTIYHPTTTCRMGGDGDSNRVVDPRLRVVGIHNLRIVDASVMPTIVNANTNAACYVIGERAAEIILEDHGYSAAA